MIIDCISDLHGKYPQMDGGDLLIVAGDLTARDITEEYVNFFEWLLIQKYRKKILIAGNHDNQLLHLYRIPEEETDLSYLCDSGCEFDGFKIWGSPWTKSFPGMNPHCKAFTLDTEEELLEKFSLIPTDTDILITHSPMHNILDEIFEEGNHVGSVALENVVNKRNIKLHVFGHIHESYGVMEFSPNLKRPIFVNASHVNQFYEAVNPPIRIIL